MVSTVLVGKPILDPDATHSHVQEIGLIYMALSPYCCQVTNLQLRATKGLCRIEILKRSPVENTTHQLLDFKCAEHEAMMLEWGLSPHRQQHPPLSPLKHR